MVKGFIERGYRTDMQQTRGQVRYLGDGAGRPERFLMPPLSVGDTCEAQRTTARHRPASAAGSSLEAPLKHL